jgi:hypothetical protein
VKAIPKVYAISAADLRASGSIKSRRRAVSGGVIGEVSFAGANIPLARFHVAPKRPTPLESDRISAGVLKGTNTPFSNAFVAIMESGHVGVFARDPGSYMKSRGGKTKHSESISEFYAPSVAAMAANAGITEETAKTAIDVFNQRMEHEIDRILAGYGGK